MILQLKMKQVRGNEIVLPPQNAPIVEHSQIVPLVQK